MMNNPASEMDSTLEEAEHYDGEPIDVCGLKGVDKKGQAHSGSAND